MKKYLLTCAVLLFIAVVTAGQQRQLNYAEVFNNSPTHIFKALPVFVKWLDDERLVI